MLKYKLILIFSLILCNFSIAQNTEIYVIPYEQVVLPQMPLVFFPVTYLDFGKNRITISDEKGKDVTTISSIVEIVEAKVYKVNSNGSNTSDGSRVTFQTQQSGNTGYPAGCYAKIVFKKPGTKYTIKFNPSIGGGPSEIPFPLSGSYPSDKVLYGKKEFKVAVGYPTSYIKDLKPKYFYGSKDVEIDFKCLEYRDTSLYSYKVFVGGQLAKSDKGSRVILDPFLANLDYNEQNIDVFGFYDNNLIMLSPSDSAVRHTRLEADFGQKGYKPNDKWKNNPDDAITLSLSNEENLMFKFFYIFDDGEGNLREIPPIEPTSAGGGIPTVTLNGNYSTGLEFIPINNWQTIKLNPSDFATIKPNSLVKLEFNFIDEKTKQSFSYKLFCIKK